MIAYVQPGEIQAASAHAGCPIMTKRTLLGWPVCLFAPGGVKARLLNRRTLLVMATDLNAYVFPLPSRYANQFAVLIWMQHPYEKRYGLCVERYRSRQRCESDPAPTQRMIERVCSLEPHTAGRVRLVAHSAGAHKILSFLSAAPSLRFNLAIHMLVLAPAAWQLY